MRPGQRRQQGLQYGIYLLFMQTINIGIDKIPPATLIGVILQVIFLALFMLVKVLWKKKYLKQITN